MNRRSFVQRVVGSVLVFLGVKSKPAGLKVVERFDGRSWLAWNMSDLLPGDVFRFRLERETEYRAAGRPVPIAGHDGRFGVMAWRRLRGEMEWS